MRELYLLDDDAPDIGWQLQALCAQTDPEAFYPEKGGSTREAKKVCLSCDVREDCLDYALANQERFGIWGGLSERERRKLIRLNPVIAVAPRPRICARADCGARLPDNASKLRKFCSEQCSHVTANRRFKAKTPVAAPRPVVTVHAPEEVPTMSETPAPSYVDQILAVMAASEGHPDPAVRAARKVVANALVALNKALRGVPLGAQVGQGGEAPIAPPAPLAAVPEPTGTLRRVNNSKRIGERVAELGVTAREIRAWAVDDGFLDVPSRGALPERLVDAYVAAHQAAS